MIINYTFSGGVDISEYYDETWEVEYEYETDIKLSDIVDFIIGKSQIRKDLPDNGSKEAFNCGVRETFGFLLKALDTDYLKDLLEEDDDFREFMYDRYEKKARKEWGEGL